MALKIDVKRMRDFKKRLLMMKGGGPMAVLLLEQLFDLLSDVKTLIVKGDKGDKGDRGDRGPFGKGNRGDRGPRGLTGKGEKGDRGPIGRALFGSRGPEGPPGKGDKGDDGSPDTPEEIRDKLTKLEDEDRLPASAIKDLPAAIASGSPGEIEFGGKTSQGIPLEIIDETISLGQAVRKIIFTGAGVSAARLTDGIVTVTISGGGAAGVETEALAGSQNGDDVDLDLTALSETYVKVLWISRQGQVLDPSTAWSQTGDTVTIVNAYAADEVYLVAYTT